MACLFLKAAPQQNSECAHCAVGAAPILGTYQVLCFCPIHAVKQDEIGGLYKRFRALDRGRKGYLSGEEFLLIPELSINPLAQACTCACVTHSCMCVCAYVRKGGGGGHAYGLRGASIVSLYRTLPDPYLYFTCSLCCPSLLLDASMISNASHCSCTCSASCASLSQ